MFRADNEIKYQYGVYIQIGNAKPYVNELTHIWNMQDLYRYIEDIEKKHRHYRQMFYIDNDFYENKYSLECGGTYYRFLKRKVLSWEDVSERNVKPQYYGKVININSIFC